LEEINVSIRIMHVLFYSIILKKINEIKASVLLIVCDFRGDTTVSALYRTEV